MTNNPRPPFDPRLFLTHTLLMCLWPSSYKSPLTPQTKGHEELIKVLPLPLVCQFSRFDNPWCGHTLLLPVSFNLPRLKCPWRKAERSWTISVRRAAKRRVCDRRQTLINALTRPPASSQTFISTALYNFMRQTRLYSGQQCDHSAQALFSSDRVKPDHTIQSK